MQVNFYSVDKGSYFILNILINERKSDKFGSIWDYFKLKVVINMTTNRTDLHGFFLLKQKPQKL